MHPGVGIAQGNVDSTDKWAAIFDPLLCALDMVDEGHFYFQGGGAFASQAKDTAAADDLVSFAGTHEALQAKADIVSAFCLIFGLEVAVQKKLRCFHLKWCADDPLVPDHMVIHLAGWRPHSVPLQTDGLMKHLGVRWDMSLHNATQEMLATEQLSLAVGRLTTMPCTMDLKKVVLEGSIFQSLVFHLKFASWSLERFHKLDRIVSKDLRRMLQLDAHSVCRVGYLAELLYLGLGEGGMGCVRLSDLVHTRKLSLITRCDKIGSEARGLMSSLLHATTGAPPRGYGGHIEIPVVTEDAPATWVTSLVKWLGVHKMELHLSGPAYSGMLTQQDIPPQVTPEYYRSAGIATVSELPSSVDGVLLRATQCWLIPELVDGDRVVLEVLGFTTACEGGHGLANVLIWTRPGSAPLAEGDVMRPGRTTMSGLHRGAVTGLTREVELFSGEVLDLVHLAAEPKGELSRKVMSIATKCVMVDRPVSETAAGISALTALLQGASKVYTDGTYSVVGPLIDRIRGTATKRAAAGIVAQSGWELRCTTLHYAWT